MKLISIVIPAYNESSRLTSTIQSIQDIVSRLDYNYEIIIINDGSSDQTRELISDLCQINTRIKGINLTRNFGKEIALTAGLEYARGHAVITMDADGQHPSGQITNFLYEREQGYKIVYNKRPQTKDVSRIKKATSKMFYIFFNTISEFKLESQTTDYRLLDRKVVDMFLKFGEKNRMYRGLIDRIGYKKKALIFDALPNANGRKPSYNYQKLFELALHSITSFSVWPLKVVGVLGLMLTITTAIMLVAVLSNILLMGNSMGFTNLGFLTLVNTFYVGLMLTSLGMIAIYIANIHQETIKRPLYIVEDEVNFS